VCRLSSRRPLVTSLCQLVVASPLVVLSLCRPLVVLSLELVVTLPLAVLSLRHPLILSCASLLLHRFSSSSCCVAHSSSPHADRLFCHLFMRRPLLVSWSRGLVVSWSRGLVVLSSHRLVVPPSRRILTPAGWRIISHHPLVVPPSCPLIGPAGCCVASPCTPLLSSRRAGHPSTRHRLAIVHRRLHQTPSNAAAVIERHRHRRH
jgi:hypothetical protein